MTASEKTNKTDRLPGVGALLGQSWKIFSQDPYIFLGFSGWLLIPIVLNLLASLVLPSQFDALSDTIFSIIVYGLLSVWATVAMIITTRQILTNKKNDSVAISKLAWRLLIPYLLTSILTAGLNLIGYMLAIIPGVIFWIWYAFAPMIVLIEGSGFIEAFHQSKALVRGRFMPILWRQLGGNCVLLIVYLVMYVLLAGSYVALSGINLEAYLNAPVTIIDVIIASGLDVILLPIFIIYSTSLYLEVKKTV
jgi:hypothetical protein